jgi:hypothetical protein
VQRLIAKTHTNFQLTLQNSAKFHTNVHFDCAKTLQNYTQISNIVCNWVPRKLLRTPGEVFFLQFLLIKGNKNSRAMGMYVVGEFFSPKAFLNLFFPKFRKPSTLLQTSEIHAPGQDTMQFLSSFLVL